MVKEKIRGDYQNAHLGHDHTYYRQRDCFIDCMGPIEISSTSEWGFFNAVLTASHNTKKGYFGDVVLRPVIVHDRAWITTGCILHNCEIGEGAVVAVGSVVRSRDVPPWTMVEGNPAMAIAEYDQEQKKWIYHDPTPLKRHTSG